MRRTLIIIALLSLIGGVIFWAGYTAMGSYFPEKTRDITYLGSRFKNALAYYFIPHQKPEFYYLIVEKNGSDLKLKQGDRLEIFYRDEFVIKDIISDDLTGKRTYVDVVGLGGANDFKVLFRGLELVDRAITEKIAKKAGRASPSHILVKYKDEVIANLPIIVRLTPQDWLRHARATDDVSAQIAFLKRALILRGTDIMVRKTLAGLYEKKGMVSEAIIQYRQIAQMNPSDLSVRQDLVRLHLAQKNYDQVIKSSEEILKINPGDSTARLNIAYAFSRQGDWEKAIDHYKAALQGKSPNPLIHYKLGEAYEKLKRSNEAIEQYRLAVSKMPKEVNARLALAEISLKTGNYDEAIKWYHEVIKRNVRNAAVYANLGLAYSGKGRIKEEIEFYRKSLKLNPKDHNVHFNLAVAYEKANREKEAIGAYKKVLSLKPGDVEATERMAHLAFKSRNYAQAIKLYEELIKKSPQNSQIHVNLGFAYGELKRYKESARHYEQAIKLGIKDPQVHYNLAVTYGLLKMEKQRIAQFEIYAAQVPSKEVLSIIANYYMQVKQYDSAIKTYLRLIDLEKKGAARASLYASVGYAYGIMGNVKKEIEYYRLSISHDPEDDEVHFSLGTAYEKLKMYQEAIESFTKALELNPGSERARAKAHQLRIKLIKLKHPPRQ